MTGYAKTNESENETKHELVQEGNRLIHVGVCTTSSTYIDLSLILYICQEVIGIPLDDVLLHASRTTTMGGNTYDIPILVHACVKALRRIGDYSHL